MAYHSQAPRSQSSAAYSAQMPIIRELIIQHSSLSTWQCCITAK